MHSHFQNCLALGLLVIATLSGCAAMPEAYHPKTPQGLFAQALRKIQDNPSDLEALSLLTQACTQGEGAACHKMGFLKMNQLTGDPRPWFEKACQLGNANGCLEMAETAPEFGTVGEMQEFLRQGCSLGSSTACAKLGKLKLAQGQTPEAKEILSSLKCSTATPESCSALAQLAESDDQDPKANSYYQVACLGDPYRYCYQYADSSFRVGKRQDGMEALDRACRNGHPRPCSQLSVLHQNEQDPHLKKRLKKNCSSKNGAACFQLALLEETFQNSYKQSRKDLQRGCQYRDGESCWNVAFLAFEKFDFETYRAQGMKACNLGSRWACYSITEKKIRTGDPSVMSELSKLCDDNHASSCLSLGAQAFWNGQRTNARSFWTKSCDLGLNLGCTAQRHFSNESLQESSLTKASYKIGCDHRGDFACALLAHEFAKKQDWSGADPIFQEACKMGNPRSCTMAKIAKVYITKPPTAYHDMEAIYRTDCSSNEPANCRDLANLLMEQGQSSEASPYLQKACDERLWDACAQLGDIDLGRNDLVAAKMNWTKACVGENVHGCMQLDRFATEK